MIENERAFVRAKERQEAEARAEAERKAIEAERLRVENAARQALDSFRAKQSEADRERMSRYIRTWLTISPFILFIAFLVDITTNGAINVVRMAVLFSLGMFLSLYVFIRYSKIKSRKEFKELIDGSSYDETAIRNAVINIVTADQSKQKAQ